MIVCLMLVEYGGQAVLNLIDEVDFEMLALALAQATRSAVAHSRDDAGA